MDLNTFFRELDDMFKKKSIKEVEGFILECLEKAKGNNDIPAILAIANELGGIYRVTNRLEDGKKIYGLAIEAIKALGLENTEQHGTTLLNLASVYSEGKESAEALKLYRQVASIFEQSGLKNDYRMAALYNNISHAHDALGQREEALGFAEKSLQIIQNLPEYPVELATTHTTLALRYMKQGRYPEAENNLQKAESIFLSLPGKRDVHYAATLNGWGELCYHQNRMEEAAARFEHALKIIKENYGENQAYEEVSGNLAKVCGNAGVRLSGLQLAENLYNNYGKKMIREKFHEYEKYMAIGLVGEGSECFGYDDIFSEDHDFTAGFCIWLPEEIYSKIGKELQEEYDHLPKGTLNGKSVETPEAKGRRGVFSIQEFYKRYTGCAGVPSTNMEWIFASETSLSTVTNGKVFVDHYGEFSAIRKEWLGFYPRDILLKKLVARIAVLSQSGQYNYERCMKRKDVGAAYIACSEFVKATVSIVYLLNKKYMPFYKWMFTGLAEMEKLREIHPMLNNLMAIADTPENINRKVSMMEEICIKVREELNRQGITENKDNFLANHCAAIMSLVADPQIRKLPFLFDAK